MSRLLDRIKNTVQKFKGLLKPIDEPTEEEAVAEEQIKRISYLTEANITHVIRQSAQHRLLIYISYNNVWRYVEPYSFRRGKNGTLFYGHDLYRGNTRSYYVHCIQEVQPTSIPFSPRWMIEIN